MDNLKAHVDGETGEIAKEFKKINVDLLLLPPNTSSFLYPNDLGINQPIKSTLRYLWESMMANLNIDET